MQLVPLHTGDVQLAVALTAAEVFFAGAMAKLGATVITYPILLVKSRRGCTS